MPNYLSTLATAQDAAKINVASRPDLASYGGRVHHRRIIHTLLTTEAAAETLKLTDLPKGARVLTSLCSAKTSADAGTALVVKVGTAGDDDAFSTSLTLSAVGTVMFEAGGIPAAATADRLIGDSNLSLTDMGVYATFVTCTALAAVNVIFDLFFELPE